MHMKLRVANEYRVFYFSLLFELHRKNYYVSLRSVTTQILRDLFEAVLLINNKLIQFLLRQFE